MKTNRAIYFIFALSLTLVSLLFSACGDNFEGIYSYSRTEIEISSGLQNSEFDALYDEYGASTYEELISVIKAKKTALAKSKKFDKMVLTFSTQQVFKVLFQGQEKTGTWTMENKKVNVTFDNINEYNLSTNYFVSAYNELYFKQVGNDGIIVYYYYKK